MKTSVVWFRKSLRLHDNPALTAACENENVDSILPLYILDPDTVGENYQKWSPNRLRFLIESLSDLDHQLSSQVREQLFILQGSPNVIFENIADSTRTIFRFHQLRVLLRTLGAEKFLLSAKKHLRKKMHRYRFNHSVPSRLFLMWKKQSPQRTTESKIDERYRSNIFFAF